VAQRPPAAAAEQPSPSDAPPRAADVEESWTPPPAPSVADGPRDVEAFDALWPAVLELVGAENKLLSAVLAEARPVAVSEEEELTVAFPATASFSKKKAEDSAHRATVTDALRQLTGQQRLRVAYELREQLPPPAQGHAGAPPRTEEEWVARLKEELDAKELDVAGPPVEDSGVEELVGAGETYSESE
jgi:hypothetical protein